MPYDFNADEVFQLAIRIEQNGARFYRKAAGLQTDSAIVEMLNSLAAMEDHHEKAFELMRTKISEAEKPPTVFDPQGEAAEYLASMADHHGGEGSPVAADSLTGNETIEEIIDIAIGLEKESILFYVGLKDFVPPKFGQDKIDDIIREERRHIVQLNGIRKKMA